MLGHKTRKFRSLTEVSLEDLVPEDYFYPQIERTIDLGFVRDLAEDFYTKSGCPTIDPAVFFKLQLFTFFETVRCAVFSLSDAFCSVVSIAMTLCYAS